MDYKGITGIIYRLESQPFKGGGEGDVYNIVGINDKCAKIYHDNLSLNETENKLKVMVKKPPSASVLSQIAWPLDLLYTQFGKFAGFIMPKINVSDELIGVYDYPPRKYINLAYNQKLIIAQNVCAVISGVHDAGFVFGDFNPNNIGVDMNTGRVAFWDTDSYHITDTFSGKTYRCKVCLDGYVAPELLAKCKQKNPQTGQSYNYENAPLETFTQETDRFALAIHIFKLLMNGYSPFGGIIANKPLDSSLAPGIGNEAIERDQYCFKPGNTHISPAVPDKSVLPKEIIELFDRAFIDGRSDPSKRPTAREWHKALMGFENQLVQCKTNMSHQYLRGLRQCPWCEIDKKFNVGIQKTINRQKALANANNPIHNIYNQNPLPVAKQKVKSKVGFKSFLIVEMVIIISFLLIDGLFIYKKIQPQYCVVEKGYFYKTKFSNYGTALYIVDGLRDGNSKSYSFEYDDLMVKPIKVKCDKDTVLYIRMTDEDGKEILRDDVTCFAGKEKVIEKEFNTDIYDSTEYTLEVSSDDKNVNYTIGISY